MFSLGIGEEESEGYWDLVEDTNVTTIMSHSGSSSPPSASSDSHLSLFSSLGFSASILISMLIVITVAIALSAAYFCIIYKLGYTSDNPRYRRGAYYRPPSKQNETVRFTFKNLDGRRPRPTTLGLKTTTSSDANLLGNPDGRDSLRTIRGTNDDFTDRRPPSVRLQQKQFNRNHKLATSSSGPPTTATDHSFVTACSVYLTPPHGDWTIDVPLFRCSRDWRYAYYSSLWPRTATTTRPPLPQRGRVR